jgi:hypothetical protein
MFMLMTCPFCHDREMEREKLRAVVRLRLSFAAMLP